MKKKETGTQVSAHVNLQYVQVNVPESLAERVAEELSQVLIGEAYLKYFTRNEDDSTPLF